MKIALVGCGGISVCHLSAIDEIKDVKLVAVADIVGEKADSAAQKYNVNSYYNLTDMLDNEEIDVLHICTPHYLHVPMATQALERGINVLLEKPCGISLDDVNKLCLAQDKSTAQIGVCFQNRYNESAIWTKNQILSGEYGEVLSARVILNWCRDEDYYSDDWHGSLEKEGGGVLINQAIHSHDLMRWLFGEDITAVTAKVANFHLKDKIEVEDSAMTLFEFESGKHAVYYATTAYSCNANSFIEIVCEKATFRIEGDTAGITDKGVFVKTMLPKEKELIGKSYWGVGHCALISDFYNHIISGKLFPIDAYEAGKSVREIVAIYESSKTDTKQNVL